MTSRFRPMKAATATGYDLPYPLYASPKFDGFRGVHFGGQLVSNKLRPFNNLRSRTLFDGLDNLDGELVMGSPTHPKVFSRTQSALNSVNKVSKLTWWVFDDFTYPKAPFEVRMQVAAERANKHPWCRVVPQKLITCREELIVMEEELILLGYEGVMLRSPDSPYKMGRATEKEGWAFKLKQFDTDTANIIGFEEAEANTNEATRDATGRLKRSKRASGMVGKGTLGSLIVAITSGPYQGVETSVTGLSDGLKDYIWANRSKFMYKAIKFDWFPPGSVDKPRHPTFKDFV